MFWEWDWQFLWLGDDTSKHALCIGFNGTLDSLFLQKRPPPYRKRNPLIYYLHGFGISYTDEIRAYIFT